MLFLIEYDRPGGKIVNLRTFDSAARKAAEDVLFETELEFYRRGIDLEVVLLEAESEEAVRRTHRRYFESLSELAAVP
ncbi:MAG: hypothetical protein M3268_06875 [Acidobacteriota bacterium]|nr:hypothetical protein [Acidobacteriota bacterium]